MLCRLFADHYHRRRVERILVVEIASAHQRNPHGGEIPRTNSAVDHIGPLIDRRIGNAFHRDDRRIAVIGERQIARDRDRLHTRQRLHATGHFVEERGPTLSIRIFHFGEVDVQRE